MARYTVRGSTVWVSNELDAEVHSDLPPGTYSISFDPFRGYYLTLIPDFELPSKLYGDALSRAERFLSTFDTRNGTTGVLLSGAKGSGKSLTMKATSVRGLARGLPTLVVSTPYKGEDFNKFIQSIDTPSILIFDEFEKVYNSEDQQQLLTLLDGTFTTKKLVILTCNDIWRIDQHMNNRPGRMFYYLKYGGISEEFVREYCEDCLHDKSKIESICTLTAMFYEFNFDMLKALVEELNRYPNDSLKEVISLININYDFGTRFEYDVTIEKDGVALPSSLFSPSVVYNPLQEENLEFSIYALSDGNAVKKRPAKSLRNSRDDEDCWAADDCEVVSKSSKSKSDDGLTHVTDISLPMQDHSKLVKSRDLSELKMTVDGYRVTMRRQKQFQWDFTHLL